MHIRPTATISAAILLAAIAASVGTRIGHREAQPADETGALLAALGASGRSALQQCRENVAIIHDVHWAAACMANDADDSPECTLPDDRASSLNAARAAGEKRCLDEAAAAGRRPLSQ